MEQRPEKRPQGGGVIAKARRRWSLARRSEAAGDSEPADGDKDIPLWRACRSISSSFFTRPETRAKAIGLSVLVLVVLLMENHIILRYSEIQKDYMTSLQQKDEVGFSTGIRKTGLVIALISPIIAAHEYLAGVLKLSWRTAVTNRLARAYLAGDGPGHSVFYRLQLRGTIDNPDQRICQDVEDFVDTIFSLVQDTGSTVLRVFSFASVLYRFSPSICWGVLAYSVFGTLVSVLGFGPRIMWYQSEAIKQEAGLRYALIRTRENAESIAFFRGGNAEWERFGTLFGSLLSTIYGSLVVGCGYSAFNRTFHWATFAVAPLLVGPRYLRGEVEFGAISQANMAFSAILGGLTLIMARMNSLSNFSVRVRRLYALEQALAQEEARVLEAMASGKAGLVCIHSAELPPGDRDILRLEGVTLRTPWREGCMQQTLVDGLGFELRSGQSLLIAGQSGIGKSSLLRAFAGLWSDGRGTVGLCSRSAVFFMPQKPYMFLGSLREQLLYPQVSGSSISDEELEQALGQVNLAYLLKQYDLDDCRDWSGMLSLGEQQRINFARVLLLRGLRLALIDEGTSACDPANEAALYDILRQRLHSYVSVGHRPALQEYHTHALWLQRPPPGGGGPAPGYHPGEPGEPGEPEPATTSFLPMSEFQGLYHGGRGRQLS